MSLGNFESIEWAIFNALSNGGARLSKAFHIKVWILGIFDETERTIAIASNLSLVELKPLVLLKKVLSEDTK